MTDLRCWTLRALGEIQPRFSRCLALYNGSSPVGTGAFVGIKNDKDIADLWAYLKQFGSDGAKK